MRQSQDIIVQKFGGTSVANVAAIKIAASKVAAEIHAGKKVIVIVSAMAGVTNQLVSYCTETSGFNKNFNTEYDVALSSGEIVTSSLMALALNNLGIEAKSFQAWQIPILSNNHHSEALIENINGSILEEHIKQNIVPVITGFQGINKDSRVTTLGRGGSDTTAAAIAASVNAGFCDIYTDVEGIFTTDPRLIKKAQHINILSYEEMLEFASMGAKVVHTRAVQIAMRYNIPLRVISTFDKNNRYSLVTNSTNIMEHREITGITYNKNIASVLIKNKIDYLPEGITLIEYHIEGDNSSLIVPIEDLGELKIDLEKHKIKYEIEAHIAIIAIVGFGIKNDKNFCTNIIQLLLNNNIKVQSANLSEIKLMLIVEEAKAQKAVKILHDKLICNI